MVSPSKIAFVELAALGHAEDFRQRPSRLVGLEPLHRARREDQHAVRGLAAQHLLPGEGHHIELVERQRLRERGRGSVADREPGTVGLDPVAVRHAHARRSAVPGEHHVVGEIDLAQVRQLAIGRLQHAGVLELELLGDVGDPALAEAFPGEHVDAARAEQGPQRHLDRAGVGRRHDADAIAGRHLQDFTGEVDGALELGLARLGAVRAADQRVLEDLEVPARALGAGPGRKKRHTRPQCRLRRHGALPFQIDAPRWGGVARCGIGRRRMRRQATLPN